MSLHHDPVIAEQLCALIDGELDPERTRFLLRRMAADAELKAAWERLHMARACLSRDGTVLARRDLAVGIATLIAMEPVPRHRAPVLMHVTRWVGGAAVAASVALLALVIVTPGNPPATEASASAALSAMQVAAPEVAPSHLRERDLKPHLAAQTASIARRADPGGTLGPVRVAQPLYLPNYLIPHSTHATYLLHRDVPSGNWIMREMPPQPMVEDKISIR